MYIIKTVYPEMNKKELEALFDEIDMNNSGSIDYTEWTQATIDKNKLLTEDNLRDAFDAFDEDHNGNISIDEIKDFFSCGRVINDKTWSKILNEVDTNKDGHVDFKEFKGMMMSFID